MATWVALSGEVVDPYAGFHPMPPQLSETGAATTTLDRLVSASLFSHARLDVDELPEGETHRSGWWADPYTEGDRFGSKLWSLMRQPLGGAVVRQVGEEIRSALAWMVADGLARSIDVQQNRIKNGVGVVITIESPDGTRKAFQYKGLWDAIR